MPTALVDAGVLKILETHLKAMESEFQSLTQKIQQIIATSTIIIGFATVLNTFNANQTSLRDSQKFFVVADFVIYILIFAFYIWVTYPKDWSAYPVGFTQGTKPTEKQIDDLRAYSTEADLNQHIIDRFAVCLDENQKILDHMSSGVRVATFLLLMEVISVGLTKFI